MEFTFMKILNPQEFKDLLKSQWSHGEPQYEFWDTFENDDGKYEWGYLTKESSLGDFSIKVNQVLQFMNNEIDSIHISEEQDTPEYELVGFKVIDEDYEYDSDDIFLTLREVNDDFLIDPEETWHFVQEPPIAIGQLEPENITVLKWQGEPDVHFTGELIASVRSHDSTAYGMDYYSGRSGDWDELKIYQVNNGQYIGQIEEKTLWTNSKDRAFGAIGSEDEVKKFFDEHFYTRLKADVYDDGREQAKNSKEFKWLQELYEDAFSHENNLSVEHDVEHDL